MILNKASVLKVNQITTTRKPIAKPIPFIKFITTTLINTYKIVKIVIETHPNLSNWGVSSK